MAPGVGMMACANVAAWLEPMLALAGRHGDVICRAGWLWLTIAWSLVSFAALLFAVQIAARLVRAPQDAAPFWRSLFGDLALLLVVVALGIALLQPVFRPADSLAGIHVVAIVDGSDSVTRAGSSLSNARSRASAALAAGLGATDNAANESTGTLVTFAQQPEVQAGLDLRTLIGAIETPPAPAESDGSRGGQALKRALESIREAERPATVLLISDGLWTDPDAAADAVAGLRKLGVPVHVWPTGSKTPALGLVAADIAAEVDAGAMVPARLVYEGSADQQARLQISRAGTLAQGKPLELPATPGWIPIRPQLTFSERGLQFVEFDLRMDDGTRQSQRLYTLVWAPPRLLVYGNAAWSSALDLQAYEVTWAAPGAPVDPSGFDAVIVDGVFAHSFPAQALDALSETVRFNGAGLMLVNGPAVGGPEAETMLGSYEDTPIGPLLPVSTDARIVLDQPPPRDAILVVDVSGSMDGRQSSVRHIADKVIGSLRPVDTLRIVAFAGEHREVLAPRRMTAAGRERARAVVAGLSYGGTTSPGGAFRYVTKVRSNYCGLFFVSDGGFDDRLHNPGCWTTIFEVNSTGQVQNPDLQDLGQVVPVGPRDRLGEIRLRFLDPEPRAHKFRDGRFVPVHYQGAPALTPDLPLPGVAITYPRIDAERISVHSSAPPDPVLAYRRARSETAAGLATGGEVAAFTSAIAAGWSAGEAGRVAIRHMIDKLLAWRDRDRYLFKLSERRGTLRMEITVLVDGGKPAKVNDIDVGVMTETGEALPFRVVERDPDYGRFVGELPLPEQGDGVVNGLLSVREAGDKAQRREQRIPIVLPVASEGGVSRSKQESLMSGIDRSYLERIAEATDGHVAPEFVSLGGRPQERPVYALHPWFLVLAAAALVGAVASGGVRL